MTKEEAIEVLKKSIDNTIEMTIREWEAFDLELAEAIDMAIEALSADAVHGYTEWLEKIIVYNGANEWLCEDTPDMEWCDENCHYSSIQAECLRHLYEVSKGGDDE